MIFKRKATDELRNWKQNGAGRYAALLEGPRRVGKSTIAEEFAKKEYRSYIKVDFANIDNDLLAAFDSISRLDEFFLRLQALTGILLYRRKSVIIFDEIQLSPKTRQAIKYLVADGRYDYIETGSLLSIKKNVKGIVIPSEEWIIRVYPMDYEEYLWACGKDSFDILREIYAKRKPMGQAINRTLMREFRTYLAVGGMPQAIESHISGNSLMETDHVKRRIIDLYEEDFFKIDPSGNISMLFDSIPSQLFRKSVRFSFNYAMKKRTGNKTSELLSDLINSRTVIPCYNCSDPTISLSQGKDLSSFKIYMADTGLFITQLLRTKTSTDEKLYAKFLSDKLPANLGYVYENAVAQILSTLGHDLYYMVWDKPGSTHKYELDFIIQKGIKTIPIEVKSSRTDSHKSIDAFSIKYSSLATSPLILSQKDLCKEGSIYVLPFYLTPFI